MNETPDPLDELLRRALADQPGPTPAETERARRRLDAAIREETAASKQRPGWLTAAAAAAVVAVGATAIWMTGGASPVMAAMEEIAQAIESAPITNRDQHYVYTDATQTALGVVPRDGLGTIDYPDRPLAYLLTTRRQTWFGIDGSLQLQITVQPPEFFRPEDETAYYAAGLDQLDRVGETSLETFPDAATTEWPSDPAQLDQWIRDSVATGRGLPHDIEYLDVALDIVRESPATPHIRAEALRLIGRLDSLEIVDQTPDATTAFGVRYHLNGIDTDHRFTLDPNGYLISELLTQIDGDPTLAIPPGTTTNRTIVHDIHTTDSLDAP